MVAAGVGVLVGISLFERFGPRRLIEVYWRTINPLFRAVAGTMPGLILLETTGRRTGRSHQVPVGGRREGGTVWLVAGHASRSDYVRNITADPRVRVRVGRKWRDGTATVVLDDDTGRRAFRVNPMNGFFIRIATSDLATVRIDLD